MDTRPNKYKDIIDLERPVSKKHKPMSIYDRAAQFAPFAALNGHSEAIDETARLTEKEIILTDAEREILDRKLTYINSLILKGETGLIIKLVYFERDKLKEGGQYIEIEDEIKKMDPNKKIIEFYGGTIVEFASVYSVGCDSHNI